MRQVALGPKDIGALAYGVSLELHIATLYSEGYYCRVAYYNYWCTIMYDYESVLIGAELETAILRRESSTQHKNYIHRQIYGKLRFA